MEPANDLKQLFNSIYLRLGGSSITVELEDQDYQESLATAVSLYRARSRNSIQEGWAFLELQEGVNEYYLPKDIDSIKEIRRRRMGYIGGGGDFEAFSAAMIGQMMTVPNSAGQPSILNYELLSSYSETLGRMFGEHFLYEFNEGTGRLYLWRSIKSKETVGLHVSRLKTITNLLRDGQAYRWLINYTEQCCRMKLGEKYTKYAILPGPQSGTNLKGGDLLSQAQQRMVELEEELSDYGDNSYGPDLFYG